MALIKPSSNWTRRSKSPSPALLYLFFGAIVIYCSYIAYLIGYCLGLAHQEYEDVDEKDIDDRLKWSIVPDGWEKLEYVDVRHHFKCRAYAREKKAIPTLEDWQLFRKKYKEAVDPTATFDDPVPPTMGYSFGYEGGPPPFYAAHGDRGRGLFASRDIKKGELVHDGTTSDIIFADGMAWRRYIFSLSRERACDVVEWSWTMKRGHSTILVSAMDISILLNGGDNGEFNGGRLYECRDCNVNPKSSASSKFFAVQNIAKGAELLTDYRIYDSHWYEVGL